MQIQRIPYSSLFILLVAFVFQTTSLPNPNHHKKVVVVEPSDEANTISKSEVGASWGGFSASAGLGGGPNGGGLHAEAGGPGLGAGAGLSGTSYSAGEAGAHAGAGAGSGVNYGGAGASAGAGSGQAGFFDNIFNIPISVLQAVNKYLNQKGTVPAAPGQHPPHPHHPQQVPQHTYEQPSLPPSVPVESDSGSSASAGASAHAGSVGAGASASAGSAAVASSGSDSGSVTYTKRRPVRTHYDDVFNIPISALRSVNQLLNG